MNSYSEYTSDLMSSYLINNIHECFTVTHEPTVYRYFAEPIPFVYTHKGIRWINRRCNYCGVLPKKGREEYSLTGFTKPCLFHLLIHYVYIDDREEKQRYYGTSIFSWRRYLDIWRLKDG